MASCSSGLPVENGRIKNEGDFRLLDGLKAFFSKYGTPTRMTCQQSILLADLDPSWKPEIEALLEEYGIAQVERYSTVRRWSMACPAMPTCGLAVTEAERALPTIMDQLEVALTTLGLESDRFTVRMTGCPNGCARPYNADIGLVGRSATRNDDGTPGPGTYTVFLGGRTLGDRLNVEFKDYVPFDRVVPELVPVFARYKAGSARRRDLRRLLPPGRGRDPGRGGEPGVRSADASRPCSQEARGSHVQRRVPSERQGFQGFIDPSGESGRSDARPREGRGSTGEGDHLVDPFCGSRLPCP